MADKNDETARGDWPAAPFTGAKWGAIAGLAAGTLYLQANQVSAFGISAFPGDAGIVIIVCVAVGVVIGAAAGWLMRS